MPGDIPTTDPKAVNPSLPEEAGGPFLPVRMRALIAADLRARLEREARAVSALAHPHICSLYDLESDGARHVLVMEYLEGETLADRLRRGPLPYAEWCRIADELTEALAYAHRCGIVHRDLKPGNVMLTAAGVKLRGVLRKARPSSRRNMHDSGRVLHAGQRSLHKRIGCLQKVIALISAACVAELMHGCPWSSLYHRANSARNSIAVASAASTS